jgi:hypothetical protein
MRDEETRGGDETSVASGGGGAVGGDDAIGGGRAVDGGSWATVGEVAHGEKDIILRGKRGGGARGGGRRSVGRPRTTALRRSTGKEAGP